MCVGMKNIHGDFHCKRPSISKLCCMQQLIARTNTFVSSVHVMPCKRKCICPLMWKMLMILW